MYKIKRKLCTRVLSLSLAAVLACGNVSTAYAVAVLPAAYTAYEVLSALLISLGVAAGAYYISSEYQRSSTDRYLAEAREKLALPDDADDNEVAFTVLDGGLDGGSSGGGNHDFKKGDKIKIGPLTNASISAFIADNMIGNMTSDGTKQVYPHLAVITGDPRTYLSTQLSIDGASDLFAEQFNVSTAGNFSENAVGVYSYCLNPSSLDIFYYKLATPLYTEAFDRLVFDGDYLYLSDSTGGFALNFCNSSLGTTKYPGSNNGYIGSLSTVATPSYKLRPYDYYESVLIVPDGVKVTSFDEQRLYNVNKLNAFTPEVDDNSELNFKVPDMEEFSQMVSTSVQTELSKYVAEQLGQRSDGDNFPDLSGIMDYLQSTLDAVKALPQQIASAFSGKLEEIKTAIENVPSSGGDASEDIDIDTDDFFLSDTIMDKFPFCIPKDIYSLVSAFNTASVAPRFEIPIKFDIYSFHYNETFYVDFTDWDSLVQVFRILQIALFLAGLMVVTRNIIRG